MKKWKADTILSANKFKIITKLYIIKPSYKQLVIILQVCIELLLFILSMNRTTRSYSLKSLRKQSAFRVTSQSFAKKTNTTHSSFNKTIMVGGYIAKSDDLIGVGSKSKVYKGICTKTGQEVALKIIKLQQLTSAVQKRFLKSELQCLKRLKSAKNIIQLHQIIESKTQVVIVTELCHQSLHNIMKKHTDKQVALEFPLAIKIFSEILLGYLEMRQRGLIHRDIKPANIFLTSDICAKLGDLGFAVSDQKLQADKMIKAGSPLYMAPQVFKSNEYSSKADIWSLGIVLLEMVIGELPWADSQEKDLEKKVVSCNFDELIPSFVDEKWREVILKCLDLNPKKRWGALQLMKFINPFFELTQLSYCQQTMIDKQKMRERNYTEMEVPSTEISKDFFRPNNSTENSRLKTFSKSALSKHHNNTYQIYSKGQKFNNQKVIEKQIINEINRERRVKRQLSSKLNLARIAFKLIEILQKEEDNIHINCLYMDNQFEQMLAKFILTLFDGIKQVKSCFGQKQSEDFKRSLQFRFLKQMVQKYEKNYRSYFSLKLFPEFFSANDQTSQLLERLRENLSKAKNHLTLIHQQMLNSGIPELFDQQICNFFKIVEHLTVVYRSLKLMMKHCEIFVQVNKLQQILKKKEKNSYSLQDIQDILNKLAQ